MSISRLHWLPHRATRPFGGTCGRLTLPWQRARQTKALESLRLAFPELDDTRRAAIARSSSMSSAAMTADLVSAGRFDAVGLCRRLTLDSWSHLDEAEQEGTGFVVLSSNLGLWQLAMVAMGLYRGPIDAVGHTFEDPLLQRWAKALANQHDQPVLTVAPTPSPQDISWKLGTGGVVACSIEPAPNSECLPFLGRPLCASPIVFQGAAEAAAAVVPIFGWPEPKGTYRVEIGEPIVPEQEASARHLMRRCLEALEQAIRRRPELWPWHLG